MAFRRFNVSIITGTFTGLTTGAQITGSTLFVGESCKALVQGLSAHMIVTSTMTNATMIAKWQGSSDGTTWTNIVNETNTSGSTLVTAGTGATATLDVSAPRGCYGHKYTRCSIVWTSTTAGTTNDIVSIGYNFRQLQAGVDNAS